MKRPADQAKLLFLYLLRSSAAALATTPQKGGAFGSSSIAPITEAATSSRVTTGTDINTHIVLRLAKRTDVPSIQRCNLATLPENYNSQFYLNHMRQWPNLCLVAEDVSDMRSAMRTDDDTSNNKKDSSNSQQRSQRSQALSRFQYNGFPGLRHNTPEPKIVAYVLGKVEEKTVPEPQPFAVVPKNHCNGRNNRRHSNDYDDYQEELLQQHLYEPPPTSTTTTTTTTVGHVTSLAVLHEHRRQGLAEALMTQLHHHLQQYYGNDNEDCVASVGLHVRKSNVAAVNLYQKEHFGYQIQHVIPHYYQDGEDAYFMKKEFNLHEQLVSGNVLSRDGVEPKRKAMLFGRPWKEQQRPPLPKSSASRFSLPRDLIVPVSKQQQQQPNERTINEHEQQQMIAAPSTSTAANDNVHEQQEQQAQISITGTL